MAHNKAVICLEVASAAWIKHRVTQFPFDSWWNIHIVADGWKWVGWWSKHLKCRPFPFDSTKWIVPTHIDWFLLLGNSSKSNSRQIATIIYSVCLSIRFHCFNATRWDKCIYQGPILVWCTAAVIFAHLCIEHIFVVLLFTYYGDI